jgi:aspartate/methionine/tyrosine aminotransferase
MNEGQFVHEYQDNSVNNFPDFAKDFVQHHVRTRLGDRSDVSFLPIPGMKPMLPLAILACGLNTNVRVRGMTSPGYPVPKIWAQDYLGRQYSALETDPANDFLFDPQSIGEVDLVMMNFPHNPTGQISTEEYLMSICSYCERYNIRLWNDAAYTIIASEDHVTLTDVALQFPDLSWAEAFSASKATNFCGWRVGAIVGSPDFVGDITTIKGNTDSGGFAPAFIGVDSAFRYEMTEIDMVSGVYAHRLRLMRTVAEKNGMKLAAVPKAGFFSLWHAPEEAFGRKVKDAAEFNALMIANTGIVGVPFGPYIRYAVVGDVEAMLPGLEAGFAAMSSDNHQT